VIGRPTGRSVRPVGCSVHTLRQSDRQSDEIKHPTVCPTGRAKCLHDTIVGPTSRTDQSDRPVGPTIVPCKRPVILPPHTIPISNVADTFPPSGWYRVAHVSQHRLSFLFITRCQHCPITWHIILRVARTINEWLTYLQRVVSGIWLRQAV